MHVQYPLKSIVGGASATSLLPGKSDYLKSYRPYYITEDILHSSLDGGLDIGSFGFVAGGDCSAQSSSIQS